MAVKLGVDFNPNTKKVEAALARIQAQAKGVEFGGGARSIEKLSRPLGKITGQASEFQKSLEASNARVLAFGASVAVINKLSQAFGALVANTIKVEASFAKINTILGGTQRQLEQFGNGIFKVAQNTATSFDQVAEGALELARQGLSVEESLSRVETALKLVRVAGIDSQQAVAGLTAAIKGFEGAGLNVAQIADKLAEVDTKFAVSTEDLINGLERASASARVAGVDFDELLGVITTVQERTQRGGAVIGNAFKTIFARLGRTDTLVALEQLGIQVLDSQGNVRSAIPLFQELAVELDRLGLKSLEAGEIIQKVAGVRQRDILISLVEDLNSGQSQFAKALEVSAGAAGSLDRKNAQLNDTLEALINNLTVGAQKLSAVIGELGFADAAKDILSVFSSVVNGITDLLQGDSIGAKFAQGLVKGIGSILTGPGLALISAIFVKLFVDLAKFGATSLKSLLGINKASEQQNLLQKSVLQTLLQNEAIQREILALEGNKVAQEQLLLKIYTQQAAALARVQKAAATVTPGLFKGGFRGGESGVGKTGRGASGYVAAEARDVSRGVGGAPASSKVVSIPNFAFGGGKRGTMVANTSEYFVPNYAGGGDAIFNRDMIRSSGLPSGARKINAADGYVPNFASPAVMSSAFNRMSSSQFVSKYGQAEFNLRQRAAATGMTASERKRRADKLKKGRKGGKLISDPRFAMIVPQVIGPKQFIQGTRAGKKVGFNMVGFEPGVGNRVKNDEQLDDSVRKYALGLANSEAKKLGGPPKAEKVLKLANTGAISALSGTIFETAVSSLLDSKDFDARSEIAAFDFAGSGANQKLKKLFPQLGSATEIEAKIRLSKGNRESMFDKILKATGNAVKSKGNAAFGYIPNFAGGSLDDAIEREKAAGVPINQIRINQSGKLRNAGNPDGLAVTNTRDEPTGRIPNFAEAPRGSRDALATAASQSKAAAAANRAAASSEKLGKSLDMSIGKFFILQTALGGLTNVLGSTGEEANGLQKTFSALGSAAMAAVNTMFVLSTVGVNPLGRTAIPKGVTQSVGKAIAGFGKLSKFLGPLAKGLFTVSRFVGPIGIGLVALNTALKVFTGKGILGQFGIGVKDATERLKDFEKELEGKNTEQRVEANEKAQSRVSNLEGQKAFFERTIKEDGLGLGAQRRGEESSDVKLARRELAKINSADGRQSLSAARAEARKTQAAVDESAAGIASGTGPEFKSGRFASEFLRDFGALGQGQLAVSGVGEGGVTGDRKKLLEEELKLAQDQGTVDKFNIESRIAGLKFEIEANKQRFQITDEFTKNIEKGGAISQKSLNIIQEQVESGGDLNDIQEALVKGGQELSDDAQKILNTDLLRLANLNKKIAAQRAEIKNEQAIIAFKQKQFKIEQNLAKLLAKNKAKAQSADLGREVETRKLSLKANKGPIGSGEARSIKFKQEMIKLDGELADLTLDKQNAEAELNALQKKGLTIADQEFRTAQDLVDSTQERLDLMEPLIAAEKKLAEFRSGQSGFSLGLEELDSRILSFEDKLGREIPGLFADNLGTAMQDAVSGAESVGDALSKAAENFATRLRDAFLQQAADQLASSIMGGIGGKGQEGTGGGLIGGLFDGIKNFFSPKETAVESVAKGGIGSFQPGAIDFSNPDSIAAAAKNFGNTPFIGPLQQEPKSKFQSGFDKGQGFISKLFGGGNKGGAARGSNPATPMFVSDVSLSKSGAGGVIENLTDGAKGAAEGEEGKGFFSGLKDKLGSFFDGFKDKMGGLFDGLKGLFTGGQGGGGGGIFGSLLKGLGGQFTGGGGGLFSFVGSMFGFQNGGRVGFANGGPVGSTDTVPAMLTPGEFVVKRSAVDKYGTDFLSSLNQGILPMQGFQNGGSVSPVAAEAGASAMGGNQVSNNSDFTFNIDQGGQVSQEGGQSSSEQQKEFAARIRSAVTTTIQEESRTGGSLNYLYKG